MSTWTRATWLASDARVGGAVSGTVSERPMSELRSSSWKACLTLSPNPIFPLLHQAHTDSYSTSASTAEAPGSPGPPREQGDRSLEKPMSLFLCCFHTLQLKPPFTMPLPPTPKQFPSACLQPHPTCLPLPPPRLRPALTAASRQCSDVDFSQPWRHHNSLKRSKFTLVRAASFASCDISSRPPPSPAHSFLPVIFAALPGVPFWVRTFLDPIAHFCRQLCSSVCLPSFLPHHRLQWRLLRRLDLPLLGNNRLLRLWRANHRQKAPCGNASAKPVTVAG